MISPNRGFYRGLKYGFFFSAILWILIVAAAYWYRSDIMQSVHTKPTIVFYGDSETALFGWTDTVANDLGANAKVVNTAKPGQTSAWGLANLQANVLAYHPDVVFLEFSMNDATWVTLDQARDNTIAMIQQIRSANSSTKIFLTTNNEPTAAAVAANPAVGNVDAYYQQYRGISAQFHVGLIDLNPGWKIIQRFMPTAMWDDYHPTLEADLAYEVPVIESALAMIGIPPTHPFSGMGYGPISLP